MPRLAEGGDDELENWLGALDSDLDSDDEGELLEGLGNVEDAEGDGDMCSPLRPKDLDNGVI